MYQTQTNFVPFSRSNPDVEIDIPSDKQEPSTTATTNQKNDDITKKTTTGAIIVVISIIAIVVISIITWYFIQDPWETPQNEESTLRKDYFKDQFSYYAWSELYQSPYLLLHLFSPTGNVFHLPHSVTSWKENEHGVIGRKLYSPIYEIHFNMISDVIGLSRLRKKGFYLKGFEVLEKWKQNNFFPMHTQRSIEQKGIDERVTTEIEIEQQDSLPMGLVTFVYQEAEQSTEIRISTHVKLIGVDVKRSDYQNEVIFYTNVVMENDSVREFFEMLTQQDRKSELNHNVKPTDTFFRAFRLEMNIYNPQWSSVIFPESAQKIQTLPS